MKFLIAIERGTDEHAWGGAVPDLPGCFSAGDSLAETMANVQEAIDLHVETLIEDGASIPAPKSLDAHHESKEYEGWIWAYVDVPVEKYFGPAEKINITVPKAILARIDEYAKKHGQSRSGFLVEAARTVMG
ncbi:MAG: type II toxin-antitoxin system HicB family antitoxin [Paucibacter sp.]|nr:type II toxin-antitoxin system HicB family antitoxin [Roseateles sp.]